MPPRIDWLSRLLDMVPVRGHLDLRCFCGAPWRIEEDRAKPGEIPYHIVLGGSAVLEDATGGPRKRLAPGDIVLLFHGGAHVLHDGSGAPPAPAHERAGLNLTISENAGTGDRLDCCAAVSSSRRRTSGCCGTICQPDWWCRRPIIARPRRSPGPVHNWRG
jgi:AraC family transcriptional activator of mtrCDE